MPSAFLENRGILRISGPDARDFLQGLVTCDVEKVAPGHAAFGALLTPQGKIIVDFILTGDGETFHLDCPLALAADLAKRLRFYKLRAAVDIADLSATLGIVASWGEPGDGEPDPRHPALGARLICPRAQLQGAHESAAATDYDINRISLGVPEGGIDFIYGDAFPHEANMDLLNGVDFKKGCYVGQEVVSRVEHRGSQRKRIARVSFEGAPPSGATLLAGDVEIGTLGSVISGKGLAMARVDRAREALERGVSITIDGRPATLALPEKRG